jgi:hypothetical protein
MLGLLAPTQRHLPFPDGTIGDADRCQLLGIYCGLAPAAATVPGNYRARVVLVQPYTATIRLVE